MVPSVTDRTPILGAEGFDALTNSIESLAAEWSLSPWRMRRLLDRYGSLVHEVLEPSSTHPTLLEPLEGRTSTCWRRSVMPPPMRARSTSTTS